MDEPTSAISVGYQSIRSDNVKQTLFDKIISGCYNIFDLIYDNLITPGCNDDTCTYLPDHGATI